MELRRCGVRGARQLANAYGPTHEAITLNQDSEGATHARLNQPVREQGCKEAQCKLDQTVREQRTDE
eukprot:14923520-Alexandrium_andersonii.AAC.1